MPWKCIAVWRAGIIELLFLEEQSIALQSDVWMHVFEMYK